MRAAYLRIFFLCAILVVFSACEEDNKAASTASPAAISGEDECALDGMIVANYPGPKAQILYREEGKRDFYCETKELFHVYIEPGMEARVAALYVQDTALIDWKKPVNNWIEAKSAFYVVGASIDGSMGPTYAPFKSRDDAAPFIKKYGGNIMTFNEVIKLIGG
ncbi:MAG: nitrous oxide reductase accessory protein NosL [bacterium]|nr:nitrous oxide reductase accessory protein NosL [bacterium]